MKQLFFTLLIIFLARGLSAQIDQEFWFVGPEAAANHGDRPVYIRISTMEDPANIHLRMPANLNFADHSCQFIVLDQAGQHRRKHDLA
jgi:hypothetical protein